MKGLLRRMTAETGKRSAAVWGLLAPVPVDSAEYNRWAVNRVEEERQSLYRFFGRAKGLESGVSRLLCRGKTYLVLESRTVEVTGRRVMTDAIVQELR